MMCRKRKIERRNLPEAQKNDTLNGAFSSVVKSLSELHLYAQNQMKDSFEAGELYGLERLWQWIIQQQCESQLTLSDIIKHLEREIALLTQNATSAFDFQIPQPPSNPCVQTPPLTAPIQNVGAQPMCLTTPPSIQVETAQFTNKSGGSYNFTNTQGSGSKTSALHILKEGFCNGGIGKLFKVIPEESYNATYPGGTLSWNNGMYTEVHVPQAYNHGEGTSKGTVCMVNGVKMADSLDVRFQNKKITEGSVCQACSLHAPQGSRMGMRIDGPSHKYNA